MLCSKGSGCDNEKPKFIKEQGGSGLSSSLEIKTISKFKQNYFSRSSIVLIVLNKLIQGIK